MIPSLLLSLLIAVPAPAQTRVETDAGAASAVPRITPVASPLSAPAPTLGATPSFAAAAAPSLALSPAPLPAAAVAAPALAPAEVHAAASAPSETPDKTAAQPEAAAAPAKDVAEPASRIRAFLARIVNPFGTKAAPEPAPATEAERLDREFAKLDLWSAVGPAAKTEIEALRAKKLSKAETKEYVRREVNEAFARIAAARGTANIGLHYNLHGGRREDYVGAGLRASKGDIALRYTMSGDSNDKVYFFQTAHTEAYAALDASNGEILYFPSRMGYALNLFAVDSPQIKAALADGQITNHGSISMDFHKGMRGIPYSAYLAPPVEVFVKTAKKVGLKKLSRDEETLATARFLEAAALAGGPYVPR